MPNDVASMLGVPELAAPEPQAPPVAAPSPAPAIQPLPNEPDASLLARAAVAEGDANNPESWKNVAGVILNRAQKSGLSVAGVLSQPGQFEAYGNGHIQSVDPNSPAYKSALAAVQGVKAGDVPYDTFYQPQIVAQRGVKPPFDPSTGTKIGTQLFGTGYAPPPQGAQLADALGLTPQERAALQTAPGPSSPEAGQPGPTNRFNFGPQFGPLSKPAEAYYRKLDDAGQFDLTADWGDPGKPQYVPAGQPVPQTAGYHWVDVNGQEHVNPGGAGERALNAMQGAFQGIPVDLGSSLTRMTGGVFGVGTPQQALQADAAQQRAYAIQHLGDPYAQAGRFAGQAALGTAAALATPELEAPAALGAFGRLAAGAGTNALRGVAATAPSVGANPQPVGQQLATGALGGVVAPAAFGAVGKVAQGLGNAGRGLIEPLTETGRGNIADRMIRARAEGSNVSNPDLTEYVPGSQPTTAEAYGNTGLAIAQRSLTNVPQFTEQGRANAAAREALVAGLKGDPATRDALVTQRDAMTAPLREAAFANKVPTDPTPVVQTIDSILASPAGQRDAVVKALGNVRSKLVGDTGVQTDPEQLYGIRQSIDDQLSPLSENKDARLAKSQLMSVKDALDQTIEQGAPGFTRYLQTYNAASQPVNEFDFLQKLNLTTPTGQVTQNQVGSALKTIARMQQAPGVNDAKSLSPATMDALNGLYSDLQRASNAGLGRGQGSDTVQKSIENATTGGPLMHPLVTAMLPHGTALSAMSALGKGFYMGQRGKILNAYADRLFNPALGQAALEAAPAPRPVFNALKGVTKSVEVPLSALAGVRLGNAVGANAQ